MQRRMKRGFSQKYIIGPSSYSGAIYNPLADDALCFRLMIKYKVDFIPYYSDEYRAQIKSVHVASKSPNKAICIAIIKSKE